MLLFALIGDQYRSYGSQNIAFSLAATRTGRGAGVEGGEREGQAPMLWDHEWEVLELGSLTSHTSSPLLAPLPLPPSLLLATLSLPPLTPA